MKKLTKKDLKNFLEQKVAEYNQHSFIAKDPVSVPHRFGRKQDIEIAGFFAAVFSWGNRTTIIQKSNELMQLMDQQPYDFIINHKTPDLKRLLNFKHRTFNTTDLLYFIKFFRSHYQHSDTLETAFLFDSGNQPPPFKNNMPVSAGNDVIKNSLCCFYQRFFSLEGAPKRTEKHIASPDKNSTCKRLNMYLRWMVRDDKKGVDFGIWKKISKADLICPVDLHVARVARELGLITRKQTDWETAIELTTALRKMDMNDPVKFDFALFGMGVSKTM